MRSIKIKFFPSNIFFFKMFLSIKGRSFATFGYSVIPKLSCQLRPIVRKVKSLLF